ncbi:MAG: hypothetical protein A3G83_15630 [Betaproteobacteria bacterium RIFCSPLOWO2_12_FULL_68_20]|nr:MAG: hypothetical protein A3G83_15630 [Betaproteobacteria bacterium RIFCSPLOWO2_12_FULL_68_20]HLB16925.1 tripartite tricarboxylate transporter substrate binding protein [Burkholderiales bacterium]
MKPALLAFFAALIAGAAHAQTWPQRHVSIVVGYAAGSGADTVARFLAEELRERTGQAFVVENRPGAGGNLAAQAVARAAPDGYTLLVTANSTHGINPSTFKQLGFDPVKDFSPVTTLLTSGFALIVNPDTVPVSTVAELTAYLRARPGQLAYASGSASALMGAALYRRLAGFDAVHIPYKSDPQALADLMGGRVHFMFTFGTLAFPAERAGKVRVLAVTSAQRMQAAPGVPTMGEAGVPDFELYGWLAAFFPAGTPREVAERASALANAAMTSEKGRAFLAKIGSEPLPGSPESLAALVASEIPKWSRLARDAGIEPQ